MQLTNRGDLSLSGERFTVTYYVTGNKKEAYDKAQDICLEQTVEFPSELVPAGPIQEHIVGQIESFGIHGKDVYEAKISYAVETTSHEFTQFLNVIFGNISIKPGIKVNSLSLPDKMLSDFKGPRWGQQGIRKLLGVEKRPLLFTALKPMGLSAKELSDLAYQFALGGIDIIKDDHGISNQAFSPFEERVKYCVDAVNRANYQTGGHTIYVPNITAAFDEIVKRAKVAKELGAGGLLISPGLTGFDAMRAIAADDTIALPIFSHPAFLGSYVFGDNGLSHAVLFGQLNRLAGADGTIYPNFGGRFSFTQQECEEIVKQCTAPMGSLKTIFPCPAGGMSLSSIPTSLKVYGRDVVFLVGGGLFRHSTDLVENSRYFRSMVETLSNGDL